MTKAADPQQSEAQIPDSVQKQADSLLKQAFIWLRDCFQRVTEDMDQLTKHRKEVQEKNRRGARQTDGRIV